MEANNAISWVVFLGFVCLPGSWLSGQVVFSDDFESGGTGWTITGGLWEAGVPTAGPASAHSGNSCVATVLSGNYLTNSNSRLISPEILLPNAGPGERVLFRFWQWFQIYFVTAQGRVQISLDDGNSWQDVSLPLTGTINGGAWTQIQRSRIQPSSHLNMTTGATGNLTPMETNIKPITIMMG